MESQVKEMILKNVPLAKHELLKPGTLTEESHFYQIQKESEKNLIFTKAIVSEPVPLNLKTTYGNRPRMFYILF